MGEGRLAVGVIVGQPDQRFGRGGCADRGRVDARLPFDRVPQRQVRAQVDRVGQFRGNSGGAIPGTRTDIGILGKFC